MSSLVKDKTENELRKKRRELVDYIALIDNELKQREKVRPPSIVKQLFYGTPSTNSEKNVKKKITPRSTIIRGTVSDMKTILRDNNISFKSSDKKEDLIAKIRSNGLIHKVESKRVTDKEKKEKEVRATVKEMREILTKNKIVHKSTAKKDELSALIRDNNLVRKTEALHLKNQK
jgi:hypothetical protein